jgi:lysophospholipase L1-like esterase
MNHIVLLGDSIFDNGRYVHQDRGEEPVIDRLQALLPRGWTATLAAIDGHVAGDVCGQLQRVPHDASHLVVSVGGNDALSQSHLLLTPAKSTVEALTKVAGARAQFRRDYREMLKGVCALGKATLVCTIYDGISLDQWGVPAGRDIMLTALAAFNDVIIDEAVRARLPILDLRRICDEDADYSDRSPIEPSAAGAAKIARAIWRIVGAHDFSSPHTVVFGKEVLLE